MQWIDISVVVLRENSGVDVFEKNSNLVSLFFFLKLYNSIFNHWQTCFQWELFSMLSVWLWAGGAHTLRSALTMCASVPQLTILKKTWIIFFYVGFFIYYIVSIASVCHSILRLRTDRCLVLCTPCMTASVDINVYATSTWTRFLQCLTIRQTQNLQGLLPLRWISDCRVKSKKKKKKIPKTSAHLCLLKLQTFWFLVRLYGTCALIVTSIICLPCLWLICFVSLK